MGDLCRKCFNCENGKCSMSDLPIHKISDTQIIESNYKCFKGKIYHFNNNALWDFNKTFDTSLYGDIMTSKEISKAISGAKLKLTSDCINNNIIV